MSSSRTGGSKLSLVPKLEIPGGVPYAPPGAHKGREERSFRELLRLP